MQHQEATGKHIIIGGGSGFVGQALTRALRARGDRVTLISRSPGPARMTWDDVAASGLPACDVVVNLAGKHILDLRRPWTSAYRDEVVRSRVETTRSLVSAINAMAHPPSLFLSTAGKCFYGSQAFRSAESYDDIDEYSAPVGVDYPASLVRLWEDAADGVDTQRVRHVKLRLGIVLAAEEPGRKKRRPGERGIFPLLQRAFRRGLVVSFGSGVQPFPWVHIDDVVGLALRVMDEDRLQGVFNAVAPGIVTNRTFTELLASKLHRRVLGHLPAWLVRSVVGSERSTILLLGQRVRPTRALEAGYRFNFQALGGCLDDLLGSRPAGLAPRADATAATSRIG